VNIETDMLISILKLTRDGPVSHEVINRDVRIPKEVATELLQRLRNDGLVYVHGNILETSDIQRLQLAVQALQSGADPERVSSFLRWKEFEGIAAVTFERNGYAIKKNLRFKHGGRRWEMDIVGYKRPLVVCVDCKHWHHGPHKSALERIVKEQIDRTSALVKSLPNPAFKIENVSWSGARFVPVVLSLIVDKFKFYNGVPIVPVLQLQDFINQLPLHTDSVLCITSNDTKNSAICQKDLAHKLF
jgi:Holliday junction resolvase-like predicted endonuclease